MGRATEDAVAEMFRERGWEVEHLGKSSRVEDRYGPRISVGGQILPAPDMRIRSGKISLWAEVKSKDTFTLRRCTGRLEFGIPSYQVDGYREVELRSGLQVLLVVAILSSGAVFTTPLRRALQHSRSYNGGAMEPMTFVDIKALRFLGVLGRSATASAVGCAG